MPLLTQRLSHQAEHVLQQAQKQGITISTAESCTGGLISALLTSVPGSSAVVQAGLVTYANVAKIKILNVPQTLLDTDGAVSEAVALAMAEGARITGQSDLAVAVTGVAGPDGGTKQKPVGLVHIAVACAGQPSLHRRNLFSGSRDEIRTATVAAALDMILDALKIHQNA